MLPVAGLAGITLDGCRGAQAPVDVPEAKARDVVGPAFEPQGHAPLVATLLFEPLRCRRVALPSAVAENVGVLWVSLTVRPANASWSPARVSSYALDVLSTDGRLAQALAQFGAPARQATFENEPVAVPSVGGTERWTFHAADTTYTLAWSVLERDGAPAPVFERDFWSHSVPRRRLEVREADVLGVPLGQTPGSVNVEGSSPATGLFTANPTPSLAQVLDDSRWEIVPSPERFEVAP